MNNNHNHSNNNRPGWYEQSPKTGSINEEWESNENTQNPNSTSNRKNLGNGDKDRDRDRDYNNRPISLKTTTKDMKTHDIISENIQKFFKYNSQNLVRATVKVDDLEQKKARTWVFFLIIVQIVICVVYGFLLVQLPQIYVYLVLAVGLAFYYVLKLVLILMFNLKRLLSCACKGSDYDPETGEYDEVFICVPVFNESQFNMERTISSITNSNYTKQKLYVIFIVDGNKGATFQTLMECLELNKYEEKVPSNARIIKHGNCNGVNYSVFLKDQNRGKRDSQWLFIEIVRNIFPEHKPPYLVFCDSDTSFEPNALRYMVDTLKYDTSIAGVSGKVKISNFGFELGTNNGCGSWDNILFRISTLLIIGMQYYDYSWNTFFTKHSESAFSAVSYLSSHFCMFRSDMILNIDATLEQRSPHHSNLSNTFNSDKRSNMSFFYVTTVQKNLPLVTEDFFSKATTGLIDRNIYDLSPERTLTSKCLQLGYKCVYDPRVICFTEAPDSIAKLLHQRRRWNNTAFISQVVNLTKLKLWFQLRTFPYQILNLFDIIGSYILLTHAVLIINEIWSPFISRVISISPSIIIFAWVLIQIIVISSTKLDISDMFYVLNTFITGLVMASSIYFFIKERMVEVVLYGVIYGNISQNWQRLIVYFIFPVLHLFVSVFSPISFFAVIGSYLMFPTMTVTSTIYSFFRMDDFSWSSR